jgi:P27 family predicted phage terminase small subunit
MNASTGKISKEDKNARINNENIIKGKDDLLVAPDSLNENQKAIFNYIVEQLRASKILGNLDIYILITASISIERLQYIESEINKHPDMLSDPKFMSSKEKYAKDFFRACNELCLSPQSRAKLANANVQASKPESPLLKALKDEDDS